jgi:hypothetical protein
MRDRYTNRVGNTEMATEIATSPLTPQKRATFFRRPLDFAADYKEKLHNARSNRSTFRIANVFPWHCRAAFNELGILASQLQRSVTSSDEFDDPAPPGVMRKSVEVRILTHSFVDELYRSIVSHLDNVIAHGGDVRILVWSDSLKEIGFAFKLLSSESRRYTNVNCGASQVQRGSLRVRLSELTNRSDVPECLLINDFAYHIAALHPDYTAANWTETSPRIPATVCFNDRHGGKIVKSVFDEIWNACEVDCPIEPEQIATQ